MGIRDSILGPIERALQLFLETVRVDQSFLPASIPEFQLAIVKYAKLF